MAQRHRLPLILTLVLAIGLSGCALPASYSSPSTDALGYQRKASFLVDFVESENSQGFHADQESARILAESINYSRLGQAAARR